jgi:predicted phosphate transport protein (TIGR00153 family)
MGWLKKLFEGNEHVFIERLVAQARIGVEGITALKEYMQTGDEAAALRVHKAEQDADEVRRILMDEINRSFVTPFDREDIFDLSRAIDDVLDYAYTTVEEMHILKIKPRDELFKLAELLLQAATEIHLATERIQDHPNVANDHARRAKAAENRIERTYREVLAATFESAKDVPDVVAILKLREVCRHMANAGDRADEAANIIANIVVKTT